MGQCVGMNGTGNDVATVTDGIRVNSTSELCPGAWISATYKGTMVHLGQVTDITPNQDLFWIMDALTGSRRLLDLAEFGVTRIAAPKRN